MCSPQAISEAELNAIMDERAFSQIRAICQRKKALTMIGPIGDSLTAQSP
jgi:hypothetical protein